jgi:predicted DNA-binding transcriptional regulator AlpA
MHVTMNHPEAEVLTRAQAAARLGLSPKTLKRYASEGRGPRYCRTGDVRGRVMYRVSDIAEWLEQRRVERSR